MKVRLDKLLLQRGLAASRERAQALILAGRVLVEEQKVEKSGAAVPEDSAIRLLGQEMRYVSRGGLKLEHAIAHWGVTLHGKCCIDVGASTGGFTDCMLQHGAARVVAVDTGYGQIDARLRQDARVRLLEKTNARFLKPDDLQMSVAIRCPIPFVAMDVSFISATLVLPAVVKAMHEHNRGLEAQLTLEAVILVKPQFEVGREQVGKGGIVRDPEAQQHAIAKVRDKAAELGATSMAVIDSPILGSEGNKEFLLYCQFKQS